MWWESRSSVNNLVAAHSNATLALNRADRREFALLACHSLSFASECLDGVSHESDVYRSQPSGTTITLSHAARRATAGSQSSALGRYVEALSIDADWRAGIIPGRPLAAYHDGLNSKTHGTPARRQHRGVAADQPTATTAASRKSVEGAQVSEQARASRLATVIASPKSSL